MASSPFSGSKTEHFWTQRLLAEAMKLCDSWDMSRAQIVVIQSSVFCHSEDKHRVCLRTPSASSVLFSTWFFLQVHSGSISKQIRLFPDMHFSSWCVCALLTGKPGEESVLLRSSRHGEHTWEWFLPCPWPECSGVVGHPPLLPLLSAALPQLAFCSNVP